MAFTIPKPSAYWEPPTESQLVSFEDQLMNTPADLSPLDPPQMPASTPPIAKKIISEGGRDTVGNKGLASRTESNNFGYMNKPGIVSAAGMLPGMLGMAGKAVNLGINANNQAATSTARNMLGLPEQSGWDQAKGIARDNKGIVSNNVSIGGAGNYPVGFEALTPDNRTTMTPEEARKRSAAVGPIQETEAPAATASAPKSTNVFSSIFDEASKALSSIFGDDETPSSQEHMQALGAKSFPNAPDAKNTNQADPRKSVGPWGAAGNVGLGKTGYGHSGTSGQSVGPSGGGKSWGGPH